VRFFDRIWRELQRAAGQLSTASQGIALRDIVERIVDHLQEKTLSTHDGTYLNNDIYVTIRGPQRQLDLLRTTVTEGKLMQALEQWVTQRPGFKFASSLRVGLAWLLDEHLEVIVTSERAYVPDETQAPVRGVLVWTSPTGKRGRREIRAGLRIGRSGGGFYPDPQDIIVDDERMSRPHAQIELDQTGSGVRLRALQPISTLDPDQEVGREQVIELRPGQRFIVGSTTFVMQRPSADNFRIEPYAAEIAADCAPVFHRNTCPITIGSSPDSEVRIVGDLRRTRFNPEVVCT
jgi:hypothetical protein